MRYRVWDTDINRLFGTYDTEAEALKLVRMLAPVYGEDGGDLAMASERDDGTFGPARSGFDLLVYAQKRRVERLGEG